MQEEAPLADGGVADIDQVLVARACGGDVRAFERLYREHAGRVHGLCLRMTHDPALAEDYTQETFVRAWRSLDRFEARSRVSTWLHRIAVNVILERRRRREPPVEYVEDIAEVDRDHDTLDTPVEEAELEAAVASLPQGARDVLTLCGIYGYAHGEAAAMLGIAEGTCKAQLHRARSLVRARLESGVRT
ncbi:MAG: ECF RNA polymerase sigma factor SigE [Steroidobacteraceae bacterium]|nr:ECF RNA polymerase sigma factor SigE [Steroidobacteraceae bacterium]